MPVNACPYCFLTENLPGSTMSSAYINNIANTTVLLFI
jgi:hypothetical protein